MNHAGTEWVPLGRIGRAKGLRGEVHLSMYNPDSETLSPRAHVCVGKDATHLAELSLKELARQNNGLVVSFSEIQTRDDAEKLNGQQLFVRRSELPKLPKGEYYCCDLIGCSVENKDGESLGVLKEVMNTGSNDIYVVQGRVEQLIPALPGVLVSVDLEARKIVLSPPEVACAI